MCVMVTIHAIVFQLYCVNIFRAFVSTNVEKMY